ncbi:autotransporter outer membrane beta-barrel domain-containing protein [Vibrio cionasavignyae]|uniref:autotransporter outer membrane beta-barrel domain-containing protein n=1 Tax=Vibrio cionasavignyae TaxID=2910252 RepID=UPI003D11711E
MNSKFNFNKTTLAVCFAISPLSFNVMADTVLSPTQGFDEYNQNQVISHNTPFLVNANASLVNANANNVNDFIAQAARGGASGSELVVADYMLNFALDNQGNGSEVSQQLLDLFASVGSSDEAAARLAGEITPDAEGSEIMATLLLVDKLRANANERIGLLRSGASYGNPSTGWNNWVSFIGGAGDKASQGNVNGYSMNNYGLNIGFDRAFNDTNMLGFSMAYSKSDIDIKNSQNTKEVESIQTMMYAGWYNDYMFIDGNVNFGRNMNSTERVIGASSGYQGETNATASYDAYNFGIQYTMGAMFDLNYFMIEPKVSYKYQWYRHTDYQETGSPASLRYDRQQYSISQLGAGVNLHQSYSTTLGLLTPTFSMMYYADLNDERVRESANLVADDSKSRFVIVGNQVGGDMLETRLNAQLQMSQAWSMTGGVNYYQVDDYKDVSVALSALYRF